MKNLKQPLMEVQNQKNQREERQKTRKKKL